MFNYGNQLKDFGIQLQNIGMQIQNIGMQMPIYNQNLGIQIHNMGINISNIAIQIYNIGLNFSNNMEFQMNNNNFFEQMQKNPMQNIINYNKEDSINKNNILTVYFLNCEDDQKTAITTTGEKSVEDLLNLYIKKIGAEKDNYFSKHWFLFNGKLIDSQEKTSIFNYGIYHCHTIEIRQKNTLNGGIIKNILCL